MLISEDAIRKRIMDLEDILKRNAKYYPLLEDPNLKRRLTVQSFNIESQLYALYFTLGMEYEYKYK